MTTPERLVFDATRTEADLKKDFAKKRFAYVQTGAQDIEWIAMNAAELRIFIAPAYNPTANDKKDCPECAGSMAQLTLDPIEYNDVLVYDKASDSTVLARRATLKSSYHVKGGWIYYKIMAMTPAGHHVVVDPFVIIRP